MNLLRNAKVRNKLMFMSASFLVFLILVGAIGFYYIQSSNSKINDMYKGDLLAIQYLGDSKATYNSSNADLFELMVTNDDSRNSQLLQSIKNKKDAIEKSIAQYDTITPDSFEVTNEKLLKGNMAISANVKTSILTLAAANKNDEAYAQYIKDLSPVNQKIEKNLSDLINYNVKTAAQANQQNLVASTNAKTIILIIIIIAIISSILISLFVIRLIVLPVIAMEKYIEKISSGDLSKETLNKARTARLYNDEIGKLGNSIIAMRENLWGLLSKVSDASEQIAASSQELNANAEESSKGVEETAKSISTIAYGAENQVNNVVDTSKVIKEMSVSINQTNENINQTVMVAGKTLEATKGGEKAINKTKEQMNNIQGTVSAIDGVVKKLGERSLKIGEIVETISSIAQQTNLLALNAAIEAARAGEQGKGFSVVAEEVRKLAEGSRKATEKISGLIGEIQNDTNNAVSSMLEGTNQVKTGMDVVDEAGKAFEDIVSLVKKITNQIQDASKASQNISTGSEKVVTSMDKVDDISKDVSTQSQTIAASIEEQTAAMHEIATASEALAKIGENLMIEVSKFKL